MCTLCIQELEPYLFSHTGEAATQHLFEVSSGLDSLVLGEAQILAQAASADPSLEWTRSYIELSINTHIYIYKLDEGWPESIHAR